MSFLKNFLQIIWGYIFRCRHNNLTRPFTIKQRSYLVCLDCGRELAYQPGTLILKDPAPLVQKPQVQETRPVDPQKAPLMPLLLRGQKKRSQRALDAA